ncbi:helix-turn-helix domain-containing protein [Micromonospora sp. NPDC002575]|uniref:helix-turn-helix domain-containing protein n=1 Tax=Micromonospora sp. NPDC002575 TaxID=3364222 RepID=UPI0036C5BAC2
MPKKKASLGPAPTGPIADFARELRELRDRAGTPTYEAMARDAHSNKSSLSKADKGVRLPSREVTLAYVRACGGPVEEWQARWKRVAQEVDPLAFRPKQPTSLPTVNALAGSVNPVDAITVEEFRAKLRQVRKRLGDPSYKEIEARARGKGVALPASTVFDMLKQGGKTLPRADRIVAFLKVCGIPEEEHDLWLKTRELIRTRKLQTAATRRALPLAPTPAEEPAADPVDHVPEPPVVAELLAEIHRLRSKLATYEAHPEWPSIRRDDPRGAMVRPYVIHGLAPLTTPPPETAPEPDGDPQPEPYQRWFATTESYPRYRGVARVPRPARGPQEPPAPGEHGPTQWGAPDPRDGLTRGVLPPVADEEETGPLDLWIDHP